MLECHSLSLFLISTNYSYSVPVKTKKGPRELNIRPHLPGIIGLVESGAFPYKPYRSTYEDHFSTDHLEIRRWSQIMQFFKAIIYTRHIFG